MCTCLCDVLLFNISGQYGVPVFFFFSLKYASLLVGSNSVDEAFSLKHRADINPYSPPCSPRKLFFIG